MLPKLCTLKEASLHHPETRSQHQDPTSTSYAHSESSRAHLKMLVKHVKCSSRLYNSAIDCLLSPALQRKELTGRLLHFNHVWPFSHTQALLLWRKSLIKVVPDEYEHQRAGRLFVNHWHKLWKCLLKANTSKRLSSSTCPVHISYLKWNNFLRKCI